METKQTSDNPSPEKSMDPNMNLTPVQLASFLSIVEHLQKQGRDDECKLLIETVHKLTISTSQASPSIEEVKQLAVQPPHSAAEKREQRRLDKEMFDELADLYSQQIYHEFNGDSYDHDPEGFYHEDESNDVNERILRLTAQMDQAVAERAYRQARRDYY